MDINIFYIYFSEHGFLSTQSFEGTWKSAGIKGALMTAHHFYSTVLPGKSIDLYISLLDSGKMMNSIHATGVGLQNPDLSF